MNRDTLVTAAEAVRYQPLAGARVTRHLIGMWKVLGKLKVRGQRGRSPLYRLGDILDTEVSTRTSGRSSRGATLAVAVAAEMQRMSQRVEAA